MKLVIDDRSEALPSDPKVLGIFEGLFNAVQKELGLESHDEEIKLKFSYSLKDKLLLLGKNAPPGVVHALETLLSNNRQYKFDGGGNTHAKKRFPMEMNIKVGEVNIVFYTLCHEMIHVSQIVSGRLVQDGVKKIFTFDGVEHKMSDLNEMGATELPYEVEAYKKGPELALKVMRKLSDELLLQVAFSTVRSLDDIPDKAKYKAKEFS